LFVHNEAVANFEGKLHHYILTDLIVVRLNNSRCRYQKLPTALLDARTRDTSVPVGHQFPQAKTALKQDEMLKGKCIEYWKGAGGISKFSV
jgi:hypothetical protein